MSTDTLNFSRKDSVLMVAPEKSLAYLDIFAAKGYLISLLDGAEISSEEELLKHLAQAMKFPDYFGNNWNALEECLSDLDWLPAKGYVIQFANADIFIKTHSSDFKVFVQIIESVKSYWNAINVDLILIVETNNPVVTAR